MTEFLLGATLVILLIVATGLVRILRGPDDVDRMMAMQLTGTGGIALAVLGGSVSGQPAVIDVALTLALLAAFAGLAFVQAAGSPEGGGE